MFYAGASVYLQECRIQLAEGEPSSALTMLREAIKALKESAPYTWTGSGKDYKSKIGDFLKRKAHSAVGAAGGANRDAHQAYRDGQAAIAHSDHVFKLAKKADKKGNDGGAAGAHHAAIRGHQAAMTKMKRVMDRANKEGDRDTADWAANAGAVHTNLRKTHMDAAKAHTDVGMGKIRHAAAKDRDANIAQHRANVAKTAADAVHNKDQSFAQMGKDQLAKSAAAQQAKARAAAAPAAAPTATGAPKAARKPAAQRIKKHTSDTAGATKVRASS